MNEKITDCINFYDNRIKNVINDIIFCVFDSNLPNLLKFYGSYQSVY